MFAVQLLSVVVVGTIIWALYRLSTTTTPAVPDGLKPLPGPKGYPFLGSVLEFPKTFSYHKFKEWSDIYGPIFQVNILGATHIVISDVEIANDLLALKGAQYSDRPPIVMLHELVSGNGNLGTSPLNKYWRNARKLAAARLSSTSLEVWDGVQVNEAKRLVRDLIKDCSSYEYLFERYSSLVMLRILYDKKVPSVEEADHVKTITNIVRTLERTGAPGTYLVDFIPQLKYLPECLAPFKAEARVLHNYEYTYFLSLFREALRRYRQAGGRPKDGPQAMVDAFLEKQDTYELSEFEAIYCMGTLFEGGSGTTSSSMQSYCLAMWHYPDWQAKVQHEIDEVVGDRLPSFEDWPYLPTVRAAIKETLRWRPVVPGGIPHLSTAADSYKGYYIPKGAIIHANQYAMFKDESVYPDPESYNPDRWLRPEFPTYQEPLTQFPNLKRYAAFGFGRRICPGLLAAERSLFIEVTMLMWACSVDKKLDSSGNVIPVPWYDYKPGNNTGPKPFDFTLKVRSEKRLSLLGSI
ncbi:hypothetical protein AYO20_03843 [Fonsecaea nubica]|uniref:Cytochrome P450 n=1 Tax=Fonsecaea nubica TaxID=856822 RepID=A0A178D3Q9_9EURO|nr:hypothetical protein AYO20_03843 [Fonsecaea nubica]OAL36788.1 hypothetical protein AYO20_03843 [Fonsecaea nubica]